jgi:hypothetical protein
VNFFIPGRTEGDLIKIFIGAKIVAGIRFNYGRYNLFMFLS